MPRYIDVAKQLVRLYRLNLDCENVIKEFLITAEPEEVAERKKGKWIPVTNGRGGFECDECHNYAPSFQDGVEWLSDYCPNCGADMRDDDIPMEYFENGGI